MPYYNTGYSPLRNRSSLRTVNAPYAYYAYFTAIFTPHKKPEEHRPRLIPLLFYICRYNSLRIILPGVLTHLRQLPGLPRSRYPPADSRPYQYPQPCQYSCLCLKLPVHSAPVYRKDFSSYQALWQILRFPPCSQESIMALLDRWMALYGV